MYPNTSKVALLSVYVDDIVFGGAPRMVEASDEIAKRFLSSPSQPLTFTFSGS